MLPVMRLWKAGAIGVLEVMRLGGLYMQNYHGVFGDACRGRRNIDVASSYFCRAAHFRSLPVSKEARGRITMGPSATPLEEWRSIDVASSYFCRAAHF